MHNSTKLSPCVWLAQKHPGVPLSCDKDGSFHTSNMVNDRSAPSCCLAVMKSVRSSTWTIGVEEDEVVPGEAETRHH
jgi:hypothetical protein